MLGNPTVQILTIYESFLELILFKSNHYALPLAGKKKVLITQAIYVAITMEKIAFHVFMQIPFHIIHEH